MVYKQLANCQNHIFPPSFYINGTEKEYFNSYFTLQSAIQGVIPECIFNLSSLKLLHLSGNDIQGSLCNSIVIGTNLQDLSLSNNRFTGPILFLVLN
jgi:hypothetical protein